MLFKILIFANLSSLTRHLLYFQCLEVLEDNEDAVLNLLMQDKIPNDSETVLCSAAAKYCDDLPVEDDYLLEEHEEHEEL